MGETPQPPEPKDVKKVWPDAIGSPKDEKRARRTQKTNLESEIDKLTEGIEDTQDMMRRTGDPALPQALDDATDAALRAQRDLRQLEEDDNNFNG